MVGKKLRNVQNEMFPYYSNEWGYFVGVEKIEFILNQIYLGSEHEINEFILKFCVDGTTQKKKTFLNFNFSVLTVCA